MAYCMITLTTPESKILTQSKKQLILNLKATFNNNTKAAWYDYEKFNLAPNRKIQKHHYQQKMVIFFRSTLTSWI